MRIAEYVFYGACAVSTLLPLVYCLSIKAFVPLRDLQWCTLNDGIPSIMFLSTIGWWLDLVIIIVCMLMVFWSVRTQELRVAQWSTEAAKGRDQKRVFVKGMLYIGTYFVVILPVLVALLPFEQNIDDYLAAALYPLQGALNVLIYSEAFNMCKGKMKERTATIAKSFKNRAPNQILPSWGIVDHQAHPSKPESTRDVAEDPNLTSKEDTVESSEDGSKDKENSNNNGNCGGGNDCIDEENPSNNITL